MKTLKIKQLTFVNFKGFRNKTIMFNDDGTTTISGANELGKTTIMDGFIYLLFGKDSTDRKDFEIKTLDEHNQVIPKLDHEVNAFLELDGKELKLSRCYREKWQKRRGTSTLEMTGHETIFEIDGVPKQAGEYAQFINSIMDETVFKMITNPHYFNSRPWKECRAILTEIVGDISDAEIAATKPSFQDLLLRVNGKSLQDLRDMINARKKDLNEELDKIPARIDEQHRNIPADEPDYAAVQADINLNEQKLKKVDGEITDKLKLSEWALQEARDKQQKIHELQSRLNTVEFQQKEVANAALLQYNADVSKLTNEISAIDVTPLQEQLKNSKSQIEQLDQKAADLREQWHQEDKKQLVFDDDQFVCPACKRPLEAADIEHKKTEIMANFNTAKLKRLDEIDREGQELIKKTQALKDESEKVKTNIQQLEDKTTQLKEWLAYLQANPVQQSGVDMTTVPEWVEVNKQLDELRKPVSAEVVDTSVLDQQKTQLQSQLDALKAKLAVRDKIQESKDRIVELEKESIDKAQQLADLEKEEFIIEEFENTKIDMVEKRVNKIFSFVRFKMFDKLINGGTEPTCQALINGVPWQDANNAGRINAGLDIINTLCDKYQITAPIFVDNAEAVNNVLPVKSQLIRLMVDWLFKCNNCGLIYSGKHSKKCPKCESKERVEYKELVIS